MHKNVLEKETHDKWESYSSVSSHTEHELAFDIFKMRSSSYRISCLSEPTEACSVTAFLFPLCADLCSVRSKLRFLYSAL